MPRVGDVFQLLSGTLAVPNTTIQSAPYNAQQNDWVTEANSPRPISAGGTGETTAGGARTELGAIGVDDLAEADTKAVVVETDSVVIIDSEDADTNKRWLVSDITAYMRTISPPTGLNRNRLVNGAMQISQEWGTAPQTANGRYPVDQWKINTTGLTGVITATQQTAEVDSPYRLNLETTTNQPTIPSGYWLLNQTIEGKRTGDFDWGGTGGKPVVLRLRVQAAQAGTYGFFLHNNPRTHTYAGTFTINTEILGPSGPITPTEVGRLVEKIIPIPAPPSGSVWAIDASAGITVCFTMAAPTASLAATAGWSVSSTIYGVTGQMNVIGTLSAQIAFSAVALYADPDSTGVAPKWEMPDEAEELRACQRYWQSSYEPGIAAGSSYLGGSTFAGMIKAANTTSTHWLSLRYGVTMRASPTMTLYPQDGSPTGSITLDGTDHPAQVSQTNQVGTLVRIQTTTGLVTGTVYACYFNWVANARP